MDNDNWVSGDEGTIQGQQIVVNTDGMYAYTLNGINDPGETDERAFWHNADDDHWLSFLPETYASTVWYLFPVIHNDIADPDPDTYAIDGCDTLSDCDVIIGDDEAVSTTITNHLSQAHRRYIYEEDPSSSVIGLPGWQSNDFFFSLEEMLTGSQYNAVKGTGGWFDIEWDDEGYAYKLITTNIFGTTMTNMVYEPSDNTTDYSYTK